MSLGIGLIIFVSVLSDESTDAFREYKPKFLQLSYDYGWSFYLALSAFATSELSALLCILGYFQRLDSSEELLRLVPGLERQIKENSRWGKVDPAAVGSGSTTEECLATTALLGNNKTDGDSSDNEGINSILRVNSRQYSFQHRKMRSKSVHFGYESHEVIDLRESSLIRCKNQNGNNASYTSDV